MKPQLLLHEHCRLPQGSRGFSLVTTVVLVLMVTIVGLSAMAVSRSQFRASGNAQYQIAALHEADRAVATAERWLLAGTNSKSSGFATRSEQATPELYPIGQLSLDPLTGTYTDANSAPVNNGASRYVIEQVAANVVPLGESDRSVIEEEGSTVCKRLNVFRITARGSGGAGASRTLQTVFSTDGC